MGTRARRLHGSWLTAALLIALMGGVLGAQVIATWNLPDDSYSAGLWDNGDEDAVLLLVWDHSAGTLPDVPLVAVLRAALPTAACSARSADSVLVASFDSRAPPLG